MVANGAIVLHRSVVGTGAIVAANAVVLYDVDVPAGRARRRCPGHDQAGPGADGGDHPRRHDVRRTGRPLPPRAAPDRLTCWRSSSPCRPARPSWRAMRCGRSASSAIEERAGREPGDRGPPRRAVDVARRGRRRDHARRRGVPGPLAVAHGRDRPGGRPTAWRAHAVPSWVDRDLVVVPAWQDVETPAGRAARRHRPRRGVRARRPPDDRADVAPAARGDVAGRDGARRRLRQRRAVGRRGRASARRTSRRSTSRWRRSRRRSPTRRATASASVVDRQHPLARRRRGRVRHRAGQPPRADRRRAGRRRCGG